MLTCEEIVVLAFARAEQFTDQYPTTRSVLYRRIGVRQQQLFARAAKVNPDYFGTSATTALVAGEADLADIADPVPTPEQITRVEIADKGTSAYANGDAVNIVPLTDPYDLPPRMTLRDRILAAVGADLTNVTSIRIYYSRVPTMLGPTDAATATEVPSPHDELLVVDLTRFLVQKAQRLDPALKQGIIADLGAEEGALLDQFDDHLTNYGPVTSRFARSPVAPPARIEGK